MDLKLEVGVVKRNLCKCSNCGHAGHKADKCCGRDVGEKRQNRPGRFRRNGGSGDKAADVVDTEKNNNEFFFSDTPCKVLSAPYVTF